VDAGCAFERDVAVGRIAASSAFGWEAVLYHVSPMGLANRRVGLAIVERHRGHGSSPVREFATSHLRSTLLLERHAVRDILRGARPDAHQLGRVDQCERLSRPVRHW
jgi:hypothetical protein